MNNSMLIQWHLFCPYKGYLVLKYLTFGKLNDKVDVYSFSILLLEIINGKNNIDFTLSTNKITFSDG
jgi:hypothetical protein